MTQVRQEPGSAEPMRLPLLGTVLVERWLPPLLLVVSFVAGAILPDTYIPVPALLWSLVPSAGILCVRLWLEREAAHGIAGTRRLLLGVVTGLALTAVLVSLNPLGSVYAFSGYLDVGRFVRGRGVPVLILVTAGLCALGQAGGLPRALELPQFLVLLLVVNVVLAGTMFVLTEQHERALAARERAARELAEAHRSNLALSDALVVRAREAGIAAERARLSREIHDTVAQGLVGIITQLEAVGPLPEAARLRVSRAEESARESLGEVRRALRALASPRLDDAPIAEALGRLVDDWSRRHQLRVATSLPPPGSESGPVDAALLRVAQEALANVARHAGASAVRIVLCDQGSQTSLEIADDGRGFDPSGVRAGFGLRGMTARITELGGSLDIDAAPGAGCRIEARVPR